MGSTVIVSATDLPSGSPATIGVGMSGAASKIVQDIRTSSSETFTANVAVPSWAAGSTVGFTVRVGDEVKARTGHFQVTS